MIELPEWAVPNGADPYYIDHGGVLSGFTADMRVNRMGNKFGYAATFPPYQSKDRGRVLVSLLIRAQTEGLRVEFPQPDFDPGSPGSPVVDGSGQAGRALAVRGLTPYYAVRQGQWLTHFRGDQGFLYISDGQVIADASGTAIISISPMLRVEPVDGDVIQLARPTIEGLVVGDQRAWRLALERHTYVDFELRERK